MSEVRDKGAELRELVLTEPRRVELREANEPAPGGQTALLRVRSVGICGTDLSIYRGEIPVSYPRVMGHEVVGEIVADAEGTFPPGTRVVVDPSVSCARCARCLEGRENLCPNGWLIGRDRDGALRELLAVPGKNLHHVPDAVPDQEAPLIQVLTTCVHGQRMVPVFPGDSVAVVGLGVTGLLHVQLARLRGAARIVGVSRSEEKRELAMGLGAEVAVAADDPRAADRVREATDGGADVVIECVGTVATLARAVEIARPGGRVLAYGTITGTGGTFPFYDLYLKELDVVSPRAARPVDFPTAIAAVASGSIVLHPLVARRVRFEDLAAALAGSEGASALKTIVEP